MRSEVAKENDGKITEENKEEKTISDKIPKETTKTTNTTVAKSTINNQDINQNLKNVKLEDLDDEENEEALQEDLAKSSDKIEEQITNLIATGHMFKAHVIAKKAFQKHPENVNIAQAYSLVLLKTGALEESRKLLYPILGVSPTLDEATGEEMITVESLLGSLFLQT